MSIWELKALLPVRRLSTKPGEKKHSGLCLNPLLVLINCLFYFILTNFLHISSINFSVELSKNVSEYSGFISNKKSKLYKKLNPTVYPNYDEFNIKNFTKLILPFNTKLFNRLIIPIKADLEKILRKIDSKKFEKNLKEFVTIYNNLNSKK